MYKHSIHHSALIVPVFARSGAWPSHPFRDTDIIHLRSLLLLLSSHNGLNIEEFSASSKERITKPSFAKRTTATIGCERQNS